MSIARPLRLTAPLAVCLLVAATATGSASAQAPGKGPGKAERAAARDAYDKGTASFEHGDYVTALDSFVKANALIPSVQALYWIAQAQDKLAHTEAAIEAYEAITARGDFGKLSEDKQATVNSRLAALKTPPAPPAAAPPAELPPASEPPPAEPPPAGASMPPPAVSEPPPQAADDDVLPKRNTAELGLLAGVMFISNANNLQAFGKPHTTFGPAFQLGARAAFFPVKVFGVEAEYAHGFGHCDCNDGNTGPKLSNSARFDVLRGHLIGQLPTSRLIPFALLGGGLLHAHSERGGADNDFAFEAGVGLKVMATRLLVPRVDARLNMTQRRNGGFTDGVAFNAEILAGLSFRLGD
jgi:hypothetical protein